MKSLKQIADEVARKNCTDHLSRVGAMPCAGCAELRYVIMAAFAEALDELTTDVKRNL